MLSIYAEKTLNLDNILAIIIIYQEQVVMISDEKIYLGNPGRN